MMGIICKLGGAICVMTATLWWGESKVKVLGRRVRHLQHFQQSLKLLSMEVAYAGSILPLAFKRVSRQIGFPAGQIYSTAAGMLSGGDDITARESWGRAVDQIAPQTCYTPRDLEVIRALGVSLGESRKEGQLTQIDLTLKRLEFVLEEAREDKSRNERMWRYLGLLGGAALVIMLL